MAKLVKADGSFSTIEPKNGKRFTLEELQGYVGGDIAPIALRHKALIEELSGSFTILMVVNLDGYPMRLPKNEKATEFAKNGAPTVMCLPVVGDVVFMRRQDFPK